MFKGFVGQSVYYGSAKDGKSIIDTILQNKKNLQITQAKFKQTGMAYCRHKTHGGVFVVVYA
jgi:hypothetical protein